MKEKRTQIEDNVVAKTKTEVKAEVETEVEAKTKAKTAVDNS